MLYAIILIFLSSRPDLPDVAIAGPFTADMCPFLLKAETDSIGTLPPGYRSRTFCGTKQQADQTAAIYQCHAISVVPLEIPEQPGATEYRYTCSGLPR